MRITVKFDRGGVPGSSHSAINKDCQTNCSMHAAHVHVVILSATAMRLHYTPIVYTAIQALPGQSIALCKSVAGHI